MRGGSVFHFKLTGVSVLAVLMATSAAMGGFTNGDFSQGLAGWTSVGDVTVNAAGEAELVADLRALVDHVRDLALGGGLAA